MWRIGLVLAFATAVAHADDGAVRIDLGVGETVERDVGYALGLLCDDASLIHAELRTTSPEANTFTVTGLKEGDTVCRVGTSPGRPTFLFDIHVRTSRQP
jgi:hypothetical protein